MIRSKIKRPSKKFVSSEIWEARGNRAKSFFALTPPLPNQFGVVRTFMGLSVFSAARLAQHAPIKHVPIHRALIKPVPIQRTWIRCARKWCARKWCAWKWKLGQ
jgi:hypothetical protein